MRAALSDIERDGQLRMSEASSKLVHPVVHLQFWEVTSPSRIACWNSGPSDCGFRRSQKRGELREPSSASLLDSVLKMRRLLALRQVTMMWELRPVPFDTGGQSYVTVTTGKTHVRAVIELTRTSVSGFPPCSWRCTSGDH